MQIPNRAALNQIDVFGSVATVNLVAGQYIRFGQIIIPAGIYRGIGFGSSATQSDAIGRIFAKLMDNSVAPGIEISGKFRVQIFSPQDRPIRVIAEFPSAALDQNATDRTKQIPLPFSGTFIGKDYKYVFEFNPDGVAGTAFVASKANSIIQIDMTDQLV